MPSLWYVGVAGGSWEAGWGSAALVFFHRFLFYWRLVALMESGYCRQGGQEQQLPPSSAPLCWVLCQQVTREAMDGEG